MIIYTKFVTPEQFNELRKDRTWRKLVIDPRKNNSRDIKVRCYLHYGYDPHRFSSVKNSFIEKLKLQSQNNKLPNEIREKFGGWYNEVFVKNGWIGEEKFKQILLIEKDYKLNLSIPIKFKKMVNL